MNRLKFTILLLVSVMVCSCIKDDGVSSSDLTILSGINGNRLLLDGRSGQSSTFSFKSNHDWAIVDYGGFSCDPSGGAKTSGNEVAMVTATPLQSNNSGDTIYLSELNFRLKNTRIVGLTAHQLPQIIAEKRKVYIESTEGSTATVTFRTKCNTEDIELIVNSEDITATISNSEKAGSFTRHTIKVTTLKSNTVTEDIPLGNVEFKVNGVVQERLKIEIIQYAAISFDRECIILPGYVGGENMFCVNSKYAITTTNNNSDKFTVTADSKKNQFIVTALVANDSNEQIKLGTITVALKDSPDSYNTIDVYQRRTKASQTIMVYFVGTSLRSYYNNNITKMLEALNSNIQHDARILATFTDSSTNATIYELRYDNISGKAVKEKIKEISLSTPYRVATFEDVIRNMKEFAPAENYSLIIGSHGHGWTSKYFVATESSRLHKMGYTLPHTLWQKPEGALTRHIGDGEYSVQYDIEEIASAVAANNIKLEYILFDACFMGNIESAYALRNCTKHIVGSPCEIMGAGFPYAKVTKHLLTENGTSYNLDKVCKEFVDHYKTDSSVGVRSACVAITHTSELEALATAMKRVNESSVKEGFSIGSVQYYDGIGNNNPVHIFYDLGDFAEQSCADSQAVAEFKAQLQKSVTSLYHTDVFYSAFDGAYHKINYYSGTTTSAMIHFCSREWQKTEWYKDTH